MTGSPYRTAAALLVIVCSYPALSQTFATLDTLPDAPDAALQTAPATSPAEPQGTASVTGIVLDVQGIPIAEATVVLAAPGKLGERSVVAGSDGSFTFTGLAPGEYRLIVTAQGLDHYTSAAFQVHSGEVVTAPTIGLKVSTTTSIDVLASPDQIAVAEVHEEEKQRVFGVFPNFYTSYIWDAQAMPTKQKYKMAFRALVDPMQFLIVAGIAGAEQFNGTYPDYGPGILGYGRRYGAATADATTSRIVGSAILPSVFHQDPRYFYQGSGTAGSRLWHAVESVFICRGDNGKPEPNFSHMLGSLTAGAVANAYHPASSRGLGLTFETFGITVGGNIAGNLFREFVLRGLVPSVPGYATGKH
jgi:hypothetical protein